MYDDSATIQLINILLKDHHYFIQDESLLMKVFYKKIDSLEEIYDEVGKIGLENKIQNPLIEDDEFFQDLYNVVGDPQFLERLLEENPSFDDFYDRLTETLSIDYFDEDLFKKFRLFLAQFSLFVDCKEVGQGLYYMLSDFLLMRVNIGEEDKVKVNYSYSDAFCSRLISFLDEDEMFYTYTDKDGDIKYHYIVKNIDNGVYQYQYQVKDLREDKFFLLSFQSNYNSINGEEYISSMEIVVKCPGCKINMCVPSDGNSPIDFVPHNDYFCDMTKEEAIDYTYDTMLSNLDCDAPIYQTINAFVSFDTDFKKNVKN